MSDPVTSNLQFADGLADTSMAGIADVCDRVLRSVSKDICAAIFENGQGQLILLGHCLVTDTPQMPDSLCRSMSPCASLAKANSGK